MKDEDYRERSRQEEAPEERAQVLRERLRRGELSEERLRYAAYLGDEAARVLVPTAPRPPAALEPWFEGLRAFGNLAWLRAIAAGVAASWAPPDPNQTEFVIRDEDGDPDFDDELDALFGESHADSVRAGQIVERAFAEALWPWLERPTPEAHARFCALFDELPGDWYPDAPAGLRDLFAQVRYDGLEAPPRLRPGDGSLADALASGRSFRELSSFPRAWVEEVAWEGLRLPGVPFPGGHLSPDQEAENEAFERDEVAPRVQAAEARLRALVTQDGLAWALRGPAE